MEIEHISREAAWNGIYNCPTKTDADGYIWVRTKDVAHMIDDIPAADVRPVVRGKWIQCNNNAGYKCSICKARVSNADVVNGNHHYCYKCGAYMGEN